MLHIDTLANTVHSMLQHHHHYAHSHVTSDHEPLAINHAVVLIMLHCQERLLKVLGKV